MNAYLTLAQAVVGQAKRDLAAARLREAKRPVGELRLDIDFYERSDAERPIESGQMTLRGQTIKWDGARWAVWRVRWTGSEWRRYRRIAGPLSYGESLVELGRQCSALGMKRTTDE